MRKQGFLPSNVTYSQHTGGGVKSVDKRTVSAYIIRGECTYSLKKSEKSCNLYRMERFIYKCQENVNGTNC